MSCKKEICARRGPRLCNPCDRCQMRFLLPSTTPIFFHEMGERRYTNKDLADVWLVEVGLARLYGDIVLFYCIWRPSC